jgi:hypothetical protein
MASKAKAGATGIPIFHWVKTGRKRERQIAYNQHRAINLNFDREKKRGKPG